MNLNKFIDRDIQTYIVRDGQWHNKKGKVELASGHVLGVRVNGDRQLTGFYVRKNIKELKDFFQIIRS